MKQEMRSVARRARRGSNLIELSLCFSTFMMLVFGVIEFSRAVWAYNLSAYLAHEGARYAMVRGGASGNPVSATQVSNYVKGLALGVDRSTINVTTTWANGSNAPGSSVTVRVQSNFTFLGPYLPQSMLWLTSRSTMTISQ